jgi:hypothetical protein
MEPIKYFYRYCTIEDALNATKATYRSESTRETTPFSISIIYSMLSLTGKLHVSINKLRPYYLFYCTHKTDIKFQIKIKLIYISQWILISTLGTDMHIS